MKHFFKKALSLALAALFTLGAVSATAFVGLLPAAAEEALVLEEEKKPIWITHFNNNAVEGAGVIFTDSESYSSGYWWYNIAFAPTPEGDVYEVKEISDGSHGGNGKTLDIPQGGFVYSLNYGNDKYRTKACSDCIDELKASVEVGQKYHFYGLDLENKTIPTTTTDKYWYEGGYVCTAQYALCTVDHGTHSSDTSGEVLVSKGKSYAISGCGTGVSDLNGSKYDANLTDGSIVNASADVTFGAESNQFAFYYSTGADASLINAPEGIGTATIDLGEVTENIATYKAHVYTPGIYGIACPEYIMVSVSDDNETFIDIGDLSGLVNNTADPYWVSLTTENGVSARYVRFTFAFKDGNTGVLLFLDELEVYADPSKADGTSAPVKETITVDGTLYDNGWKADGWKEVTPETGRWQTEPTTEDTLSYKYQFRADDEYLYVAVEAACKSVDGGNGNGTNLRLWINSDPEATIFTHFYDVFTQDGETKVRAKRNTSKTKYKGENIENSTIEAKYVGGEEKVVVEFKVKLSEFNGAEGFKYFICVSNRVNENICLYNAQIPLTNPDDRLANFPYKLWNKETETPVTVADIKLGEISGDPQPPVDDDSDKKYIEKIIASVGEKNPDGQFDLVIEAPGKYKAGDEITVNVKIKNIKVEEGIASLLADFYYDNEKLTLLNTADEDGAIECITLPDSWENLVKQDKDEQHNVIDNGHITLAVLTGKKKPVKDDDSLTFTFKFKVKEDAKNAIGFYIPHESVTAKKYDLTDVLGNGGYAITKMHVEGGTSSSSSTAQTGDGSTSMIVFAIVALVAICGSAVVIKSRK